MSILTEIPITHTMIYGCKGNTPEHYLSKLNRSTLIAEVLELLHNQESLREVRNFCDEFFSSENNQLAHDLWSKYFYLSCNKEEISSTISAEYLILSKRTALELLRICFSLPIDKTNQTKDIVSIEEGVFKTLLVINEKLVQPNLKKIDKLPQPISDAYLIWINTLPYKKFTTFDLMPKFLALCKKIELVVNFCNKQDNYKKIADRFLASYHCDSWEKYIYILSKLFFLNGGNEDSFKIIRLNPKDTLYQKEMAILSSLSINIQDIIPLKENLNYKTFQNTPLIQTKENEFLVIYASLYIEQIYKNLIYKFEEINKSLSKEESSNFVQDYSINLLRQYLFNETMKGVLIGRNCISLSSQECRQISSTGAPDYYIRTGNDLFLVSFQDVSMHLNITEIVDYNQTEQFIEETMLSKETSAITKLRNQIKQLIANNFPWDKTLNNKKVKIYPILVVEDSTFAMQGLCYLLNECFLNTLHDNGINKEQLKNLVVIDIHTFLLYQNDFTNKKKGITLKKVIDGYHKALKKKVSDANTKASEFNYLLSISDFIQNINKITSKKELIESLITKLKAKKIE